MEIEMHVETCCNCHCVFAFPKSVFVALKNCKNIFYCPNGHGQHYAGESDGDRASRLTEQLSEAQKTIDLLKKTKKRKVR